MTTRIEKVQYNPIGYEGDITVVEQVDGSYDVVFGSYVVNVVDLDDPVEITNASYRVGFFNKQDSDELVEVAYIAPPEPEPKKRYAIWGVVEKSKKLPCCEPPTGINFQGAPDLTIKPHMKVWVREGHGLILQKIFYKDFDFVTQTASNPLVRVRYHWLLEPESNFVIKRDEVISYYSEDKDENGDAIILPYTKTWTKYYDTAIKQIDEIIRRRKNVISSLKDSVITQIAVTHTAANPAAPTPLEVKEAIGLGQAYLDDVAAEVNMFVENGTNTLASLTLNREAMEPEHIWLNNTLWPWGMPDVTIAQAIAAEILSDTSDVIDTFDWNTLPTH